MGAVVLDFHGDNAAEYGGPLSVRLPLPKVACKGTGTLAKHSFVHEAANVTQDDTCSKDAPNNNCYEFAECRGLIV